MKMNRQKVKKVIFPIVALMLLCLAWGEGQVAQGAEDPDWGVLRLGGADRYETAALVALDVYDSSDTVIIARGDEVGDFADGLSASVLAGVLDAPILLTKPDALPEATADAVGDLEASEAVIMGGTGAIYAAVAASLEELDLEVKRIGGADRYETAALVAAEAASEGALGRYAFIINGRATPDALVAGAAAFRDGIAILQVGYDYIPEVTEEAIDELGLSELNMVGGTSVISSGVRTGLSRLAETVERLHGEDRYATSVDFAGEMFPGEGNVVLSGGQDGRLADAVGACIYEQPILYVQSIPSVVQDYLDEVITAISAVKIMGGTVAVASEVEDYVLAMIMTLRDEEKPSPPGTSPGDPDEPSPPAPTPAEFVIEQVAYDEEVDLNEIFEVEVAINNEGEKEGTLELQLYWDQDDGQGEADATVDLTVSGGGSDTAELEYTVSENTDLGDTNFYITAEDYDYTGAVMVFNTIDVHDAEELEEALENQEDGKYNRIRLANDISEDVSEVEITQHGLVFDLNSNSLTLDADQDFMITGDNVQLRGSELSLHGEGKFLAESGDLYIRGLNLTTEREDFVAYNEGDLKLVIMDSDIDLGDGGLEIEADGEGAVVLVDITESTFRGLDFEIDAAGDEADVTVNILASQFDVGRDFDIEAGGNEANVNINIDGSDFDLYYGDLGIDADGNDSMVTISITDSEFDVGELFSDYLEIDAGGDNADVAINIIGSEFDVGDEFVIAADGDNAELELNIADSVLEVGAYIEIEVDGEEADVVMDISESTFTAQDLTMDIAGDNTVDIAGSTFDLRDFEIIVRDEGTSLELTIDEETTFKLQNDFEIDVRDNEISLTINIEGDTTFDGDSFVIDADNSESSEIALNIHASTFILEDFEIDSYGADHADIDVDISHSQFDLGDDFVIDAYADETDFSLTIAETVFECEGYIEILAEHKDQVITLDIVNSEFDIDGYFELYFHGDDAEVEVNITDSEFVMEDFYLDASGDRAEVVFNISGSDFELGDNDFEIDVDGDDADITVEIVDTDFRLIDEFEIDVSGDGADVKVNIEEIDLDTYYFFLDADGFETDIDLTIADSEFRNKGDFCICADSGGEVAVDISNVEFRVDYELRIEAVGSLDPVDAVISDCYFIEVGAETGNLVFSGELEMHRAEFGQVDCLELEDDTTLYVYNATDDGNPIDAEGDFEAAFGDITLNLNTVIKVYWDGILIEELLGPA